jgi:hypothetical protein
VIVGDFDVVSIAFLPDKANSPLIVDANAVLSPSIAAQSFQVISWRRSQIAEPNRSIQLPQFSKCHSLKVLKSFDGLPAMETFRLGRSKRLDHPLIVYRFALNV